MVPREDEQSALDVFNQNEIGGIHYDTRGSAACVPKWPAGGDWLSADSSGRCSIANTRCVVKYERDVVGEIFNVETSWKIQGYSKAARIVCLDDNQQFVENWVENRSSMCSALGDCGLSVNYLNKTGKYDNNKDLFKILGKLSGAFETEEE